MKRIGVAIVLAWGCSVDGGYTYGDDGAGNLGGASGAESSGGTGGEGNPDGGVGGEGPDSSGGSPDGGIAGASDGGMGDTDPGGAAGTSGATGTGGMVPAGGAGGTNVEGEGGEPTAPPEGACVEDPCQNGGTCLEEEDGYECACEDGFSGPLCEVNDDECTPNPCQNGAECTDGDNAYTCSCTSRYTGASCEYLEFKLVPSDFLSGGWATAATAISNDGKVLLMNASKSDGSNAIGRLVDFSAANTVSLPSPYIDGSGFGIDDDGGTIVGSAESDDRDHAIRTDGTVTTTLDLSPIGWGEATTISRDVSADGTTVVGTIWAGGGTTSFHCRSGEACREILIDESWIEHAATSVSGDGSIVVGYTTPADPASAPGTAWRWDTSAAEATVLSVPSSTWTFPRARSISRNGQVIVGEAEINGVNHAVRWNGSPLAAAELGTGRANGTNSDGSVTVGVNGTGVPVVWFGASAQTLVSILGANPDLADVTLTDAVAVSDDGKVVAGTATVGGVNRAFMARLP